MVRAAHRLARSRLRNLPGYRRGLSDLAQALSAFARAIRCERRLAQLAPHIFDSSVVARDVREQEERRRWLQELALALEKVYGPDAGAGTRADPERDDLPRLGLRTRRAVERELEDRDAWLAAGCLAWARHRQRRPHAIPSLSQTARLCLFGTIFGRLACGLEPRQPAPPAPADVPDFKAGLARIYGHSDGETAL